MNKSFEEDVVSFKAHYMPTDARWVQKRYMHYHLKVPSGCNITKLEGRIWELNCYMGLMPGTPRVLDKDEILELILFKSHPVYITMMAQDNYKMHLKPYAETIACMKRLEVLARSYEMARGDQ